MKTKAKKNIDKNKYTEQQRKTFIACVVVMISYLVLLCFVVPRSFWTFGAIHTILVAGTLFFIWIGGASKIITYLALFLSCTGAAIALVLIIYYFTILSSLANG